MYACMYVSTLESHIHTYTYIHTYMCIHMHTCIYTYIHTQMYAFSYDGSWVMDKQNDSAHTYINIHMHIDEMFRSSPREPETKIPVPTRPGGGRPKHVSRPGAPPPGPPWTKIGRHYSEYTATNGETAIYIHIHTHNCIYIYYLLQAIPTHAKPNLSPTCVDLYWRL